MATITEDYVSFEVAKLLRNKGFEEVCSAYYEDFGKTQRLYMCNKRGSSNIAFKQRNDLENRFNLPKERYKCAAPTLQMTMKWLRLRHHFYVHVVIYCDQESGPYWNWFIDNTETGQTVGENTSLMQCDSPEEAYNNGIKYCLENLIK